METLKKHAVTNPSKKPQLWLWLFGPMVEFKKFLEHLNKHVKMSYTGNIIKQSTVVFECVSVQEKRINLDTVYRIKKRMNRYLHANCPSSSTILLHLGE